MTFFCVVLWDSSLGIKTSRLQHHKLWGGQIMILQEALDYGVWGHPIVPELGGSVPLGV